MNNLITTAVILAGGLGTRLAEETHLKPKPMVEIGGHPILWHIMKLYSYFGVSNFIICAGYKSEAIKDYFLHYRARASDITVDLSDGSVSFNGAQPEPWTVTIADTGLASMTGGRLRRVEKYLEDNEDFFFTYGDGIGNVDIRALTNHHFQLGRTATVTVANPPGRFGIITTNDNRVISFKEKPFDREALVNAGFFVLNRNVFKYISSDETVWEKEPLEALAAANELSCYHHRGYWQPMDTLRDKHELEKLWGAGAPWKIW